MNEYQANGQLVTETTSINISEVVEMEMRYFFYFLCTAKTSKIF